LKMIDLFCGAGGASAGYSRSGLFKSIVGVDIDDHSDNYPFRFVRGDLTERENLLQFIKAETPDFIHASPPCQAYSWAAKRWADVERVDLVAYTRVLLDEIGIPYVIENVQGAPLINPVRLCGQMFGLNVIRHRLFECGGFSISEPEHLKHKLPIKRLARDGSGRTVQRSQYCTVAGHGGESDSFRMADWEAAMGIDWMTRKQLTESIPPAYTHYIGKMWGATTYCNYHADGPGWEACSDDFEGLCSGQKHPATDAPARAQS
jgi:DNA (cytosine-5)-methyltransferase 1